MTAKRTNHKGLDIIACVKVVPRPEEVVVDKATATLDRAKARSLINPPDMNLLEVALELKDLHGGQVTLLSMGPPLFESYLRIAMAMGADRAVLLSDRAFAGADTLATSYALAAAIKQIQKDMPVDLVFAGKQTIDGDTAQVGPGIAKRLNLHQLTYVAAIRSLDLEGHAVTVERRAEGGVQVLTTKLPCLVTMLEGTNEIRRGSIEAALRAARTEIVTWNAAAAGIANVAQCGLKGSPTVVKRVFAPTPRSDKAFQVQTENLSADAIAADALTQIFARLPALEAELTQSAQS